MRALLDVNVLLAFFDIGHIHHDRARAWWKLHASAVHGSPSLHWPSAQHSRHSAPQSLGRVAVHTQVPLLQNAPGLHGVLQAPQWASLRVRSVSQPSPGSVLQSPNAEDAQTGIAPRQT